MPNETSPLNDAAFKERFKYEPNLVAGKRIIVTGGTTGIGRAIAMLLVAKGARVLTFGRHQEELDAAIGEIKRVGGGEIFGTLGDTSKPEDMKRIFDEADRRLGGLDILVNNAAVAANSITDMSDDEWRKVIDINLVGYMTCCREAADRMRGAKDGHIVNIGSMSAKVREEGSDVYVATKAGIEGFTDSLAKTLNKDGIRVSLIEPGLVGSDMTLDQVKKEDQRKKQADWEMLSAEELAQTVLFCLEQPKRCSIAMIHIRPTKQFI